MIKKNKDTPEGKEFWDHVEQTHVVVRSWPRWKTAGWDVGQEESEFLRLERAKIKSLTTYYVKTEYGDTAEGHAFTSEEEASIAWDEAAKHLVTGFTLTLTKVTQTFGSKYFNERKMETLRMVQK